jgi:hypothetical protein
MSAFPIERFREKTFVRRLQMILYNQRQENDDVAMIPLDLTTVDLPDVVSTLWQ